MEKNIHLKRALIASLIAGIIIELLLFAVYFYGVGSLFSSPQIIGLIILVIIGFYVYYELTSYASGDRVIKYVAPIGIILGIIGVGVGALYENPYYGGALIVVAYYTEIFVGGSLRKKLYSIHPGAINMFVAGVLIFILSLPLVLYNNSFVLIPIIGNLVKIVGLTLLVAKT